MQMIAFKLRQFPLGFVALAFSSFPFRDVLPQSAYFSVPHEFSLHVDRLRKVSTRWGGPSYSTDVPSVFKTRCPGAANHEAKRPHLGHRYVGLQNQYPPSL